VAVQFPDLRSGAAKRQFALASRYWVDTYVLLAAAHRLRLREPRAFLPGRHVLPLLLRLRPAASTLQAANATLDGEGSPCVSFVAEQITDAGGAVMCTIVLQLPGHDGAQAPQPLRVPSRPVPRSRPSKMKPRAVAREEVAAGLHGDQALLSNLPAWVHGTT
jgi:hypothetical protein